MNIRVKETLSLQGTYTGRLIANKQAIIEKSTSYQMYWPDWSGQEAYCFAIPFRAECILSHILCD